MPKSPVFVILLLACISARYLHFISCAYSCVAVWKGNSVDIIPNDRGTAVRACYNSSHIICWYDQRILIWSVVFSRREDHAFICFFRQGRQTSGRRYLDSVSWFLQFFFIFFLFFFIIIIFVAFLINYYCYYYYFCFSNIFKIQWMMFS